MSTYIKNPKGRIVQVSDDAAVYLLATNPTSTIAGVPLTNNKGQKVQVIKAEHEKNYSEPTKKEVEDFLKGSSQDDAKAAAKEADIEAAKAEKEAKKAADAEAKAQEKKEKAEKAADAAKAQGSPSTEN